FCALAVVSAFGALRVQAWASSSRIRHLVLPTIVILLTLESASAPLRLEVVPRGVPEVYRTVRALGPGVMLELPTPERGQYPGADAMYTFWSVTHWNPLVNGYSGYIPASYQETLRRLATFPDDRSISRLGDLHVRYIVVHEFFYDSDDFK